MRRLRQVHVLVESNEGKRVNGIRGMDYNVVSSIMVIMYNAWIMENLSDKTYI